jgi:hypothetical protein
LDRFVVYADVLGFKQLVLAHRTAAAETLGHRRMNARRMLASVRYGNPLQRQFKTFHETLDNAITNINWADEATVAVFSDSLFLATSESLHCATFCEELMRVCMMNDVTIRIGVGFGSFVVNDFAFEAGQKLKVVTTQFLGTGVVYAVDAEKALKGMRIALHPSAADMLEPPTQGTVRRLPLPAEEAGENASHEWNYLPSGRITVPVASSPKHLDARAFIDHVQRLRAAAPNDPTVQVHYEATLAAMNRMTPHLRNDWFRPGR